MDCTETGTDGTGTDTNCTGTGTDSTGTKTDGTGTGTESTGTDHSTFQYTSKYMI